MSAFCYNQIEFCFLEEIEVGQNRTVTLNKFEHGMVSNVHHTFPIKELRTGRFKVLQIDSISYQLSFVKIDNLLKSDFGGFTEFIVEIEN